MSAEKDAEEGAIPPVAAPPSSSMDVVVLQSADQELFEVSTAVASQSVLVRELADEMVVGEQEEIPLPNVSSEMLAKVIEFCEHNLEEPLEDFEKPLVSSNLEDFISTWYVSFVDMDQKKVFELIAAANYMDVPQLLDLACAKVAADLKAMPEADRIAKFGPPVQLTPEQEQQVRDANKWETSPPPRTPSLR